MKCIYLWFSMVLYCKYIEQFLFACIFNNCDIQIYITIKLTLIPYNNNKMSQYQN